MSVIVDTFRGVDWYDKLKGWPCFVVFHSPKDFPNRYVCRLFDAGKPQRLITVAKTLRGIRKTIPTDRFMRVPRSATDDPVIQETWL